LAAVKPLGASSIRHSSRNWNLFDPFSAAVDADVEESEIPAFAGMTVMFCRQL
jgi:hypothetical protein